jgi:hypothetical protein
MRKSFLHRDKIYAPQKDDTMATRVTPPRDEHRHRNDDTRMHNIEQQVVFRDTNCCRLENLEPSPLQRRVRSLQRHLVGAANPPTLATASTSGK